jgi:hypothetical protein
MFGLFSRPVRRPRHIRRTSGRPVLRVEALEARANPDANPALANVASTWTSATSVVISGTVVDSSGSTTVLIGGAASGVVQTAANGSFTVSLNLIQAGTVLLAAQPIQLDAATPITIVSAAQPTLTNVTITQVDGVWHITGQVVGGTPGSTVINIISSIPSVNGQTQVVENADGTFDIGITLPAGTPGGTISIQAVDTSTDEASDVWTGLIG